MEGTNKNRLVDYLNTTIKVLIDKQLDSKNKFAENTIAFIDLQLGNISDSLSMVEDQLQLFRSANKIIDLSATGANIIEQMSDLEKLKAEEELKAK
jgi:uncharacterized protein involved in exopolysaccharide biosynthesis